MSLGAVTGLLHKGQVAIPEERLKELEAKERAHDAYLRATQRMRAHGLGPLPEGWREGIRTFSRYVVEESRNGD